MNDRFKFRVWNNKHNRYIVDSHYPIGSDHSIVIKQDGKAYNLGLGDYEDYSNIHSWAVMEEFTDCILEQCTGLKDKNGNLIYEGDVVLFNDDDYPWQIKWNEVFARWVLYSPLGSNEDGEEELTNTDTEYLKIIGNIHEQAEQKDKE